MLALASHISSHYYRSLPTSRPQPVESVKIIADSISQDGHRLTTFQLRYWRAIHADLMSHRAFSRNASSSRAIPVKKMLQQVWNDPAMPVHWGVNRPGMQAKEQLKGWRLALTKLLWKTASKVACGFAWGAIKLKLHKQVANRLLEPWQYIHVVLTATEFDNWFELRDHEDAQPEIQKLAREMKEAMDKHSPTVLKEGEWHLPYITEYDKDTARLVYFNEDLLKKISSARCCRVSYLKHNGTPASVEEELDLCDKLASVKPLHASPFEHVATPSATNVDGQWGNFKGWRQYRKEVEKTLQVKEDVKLLAHADTSDDLLLKLSYRMPDVSVSNRYRSGKTVFERKGYGWNPITCNQDYEEIIKKFDVATRLPNYHQLKREVVLQVIVDNPDMFIHKTLRT